jgi:uncharacterized membrane protein YkoI
MANKAMKAMKAIKTTKTMKAAATAPKMAKTAMKVKNGPKAKINMALIKAQSEMDMSDGDVEHMRYLLYQEFGLKVPEINKHRNWRYLED